MPKISDKLLAYKVARSYYIDNIPQNQIAKMMGISTPQISRLLQKAREYGIVQIIVAPPQVDNLNDIQERFIQLTGIKELIIADVPEEQKDDSEAIQNSIHYLAAEYLPDLIYKSKFTGIGWGSTIYKIALAMDYSMHTTDTCFVPLIGNAGSYRPAFQINSIVDRLAEKFKARSYFINAPAFGLAPDIKNVAMKSTTMQPVLEAWDSLDLAVFGLGSAWENSSKDLQEEFGNQQSEELIQQGNVGNIVGHFFDGNGRYNFINYEKKILTIPIEKLLSAKRRVCVAGGVEKEKGIFIASKMGLFDTLITDKKTVLNILNNFTNMNYG